MDSNTQISESNLDEKLRQIHEKADAVIFSYDTRNAMELLMYNTVDVWYSVKEQLATGNGMIMFYFTSDTINKGIVKLDKKTSSYKHLHVDVSERFKVLSGKLYYIKFKKNGTIEKGFIEEGESITFCINEKHVVYTIDEEAYLKIKISKE